MSARVAPVPQALANLDPIWAALRNEAAQAVADEPLLAALFYGAILNQPSLEMAIIHRIATRLAHQDVQGELLVQAFTDALNAEPEMGQDFRADVAAVLDRDPACHRHIEPVLYFKGFQALETHRMAHRLWHLGRRDMALYLQSRSSVVFGVDIHPNARFGRGVMIDHATGVVVGETAVVGDNVSMLHGVNLGGNGKDDGDRHPKIGSGVLLGANAKVLGNIHVGDCARVAAGSVVLRDVPRAVTVAGVPAKIVGEAGCSNPARVMDHVFAADYKDQGADI
ncbi:serine O-acetyltransferase [Niveispirillum cyanobacteriorum]|uniref:Serine acetyltransferase n=1 Tax=Niveispirillum cyanobacteriorum TaxID=1612173 RepID=A0A2K9NKG0_9PROT|nr:serine O-acetyltransferase [Niveispirillum cyanobacteriorum]AUN33541.1 serine O-acetyltransferase [Niveispirillum cyanobacteriorum]GGE47665.1 serine acetyltransferase [Niveispirillum cyanobacteriorum]